MSKRPQTLIEAAAELRDALVDLGQIVAVHFRLAELCDWLAVRLARRRRS